MTDEAPARPSGPRVTPPPDGVDLLRLEEVAFLMRNSARSVRRLIAAGKLRALTVTPSGTGLLVRREEVERYLRGAEFVERPETPDEPRSKRDGAGFQVKADWVTDIDPFASKRKGRKPSSN